MLCRADPLLNDYVLHFLNLTLLYAYNERVEKVTFLKTASSADSKIGNYFPSAKVLEPDNRAWGSTFEENLMIVET
jgi:hypothetical protein